MIEEWKPIDGFEGRYEISNTGRVKSIARRERMKQPTTQGGYHIANLSKGNKTYRFLVHRLVAKAFVGQPPNGKDCINHKDGNKLNNTPDNLEWCDRVENMHHAWQTGLCSPRKIDAATAVLIRDADGTITAIASRFGVSRTLAWNIRTGRAWKNPGVYIPQPNEAAP